MGKDKKEKCERVFTLTLVKETRYDELMVTLKSIDSEIPRGMLSYEPLEPENLKHCTIKFIKVSCSDLEITRYLVDFCDFLNGYLSEPPEKLEKLLEQK